MNSNNSVWIVDDDRSIRWVLDKSLSKKGLITQTFENGDELLNRLTHESPDAIISDIRMPGMNGLDLLSTIQESHPSLPVIIMTAHSDLDSAVASYSRGAFEYLPKPFDIEDAIAITQRALDHSNDTERDSTKSVSKSHPEIIGEAPAMQEVFRAIGRLSNSNISVLINGESGTGKELVAHALHKHSPRKDMQFVPLNVAAIPKELIESELFGHEKGAFTGATQQRTGRFEQANGGTLFLDEIGDMPPDTQTRLLRVLSDGEFYRVGGHTSIKVDVRIIAATHQNLEDLVTKNSFREDLFHRLNVFQIIIEPLAKRVEDIPLLVDYFSNKISNSYNLKKLYISGDNSYLINHTWPGNVRELRNLIERVAILANNNNDKISAIIKESIKQEENQVYSESNFSVPLKEARENFEKDYLTTQLKKFGGNVSKTAKFVGMERSALHRKLKDLGVKDLN